LQRYTVTPPFLNKKLPIDAVTGIEVIRKGSKNGRDLDEMETMTKR
jgi:hypothetical protein